MGVGRPAELSLSGIEDRAVHGFAVADVGTQDRVYCACCLQVGGVREDLSKTMGGYVMPPTTLIKVATSGTDSLL